jgi:diacylglycerol kinase
MKRLVDLRKSSRSFRYAGKGIRALFRYENNARIHLMAALLVLGAGLFFRVSLTEWGLLITQIVLVWMAEAFNTALEKLSDKVSPDYHPLIESVKDLAAGAVLLTALGAALVGSLIFLPKLIPFILALFL